MHNFMHTMRRHLHSSSQRWWRAYSTANSLATMSSKYAFTKALKEVRFVFCQTSEHSGPTRWVYLSFRGRWAGEHEPAASAGIQGAMANFVYHRSFLTRAYPTMKKNNPHTPIMLRDAAGTQPRVYARYGEQASSWRCCHSSGDHILCKIGLILYRIWKGEDRVVNG